MKKLNFVRNIILYNVSFVSLMEFQIVKVVFEIILINDSIETHPPTSTNISTYV